MDARESEFKKNMDPRDAWKYCGAVYNIHIFNKPDERVYIYLEAN